MYTIHAGTPSAPESHPAHAACDNRLQGRRPQAIVGEASGKRGRSGRGPSHGLPAPKAPCLLLPWQQSAAVFSAQLPYSPEWTWRQKTEVAQGLVLPCAPTMAAKLLAGPWSDQQWPQWGRGCPEAPRTCPHNSQDENGSTCKGTPWDIVSPWQPSGEGTVQP